jgi:hypothetical protein
MVIDTGGRKLFYVLPDKKIYAHPDLGRPRGLRLHRHRPQAENRPGAIGIHRVKCANVTATFLRR